MAKHVLKSVNPEALAIALDDAEERGLVRTIPDPDKAPEDCVYLRYVGNEQLKVLTSRLHSIDVRFRTPAAAPKDKVIRKVFHKAVILHVLRFVFPRDQDFASLVGSLSSVNRKYWKVV